VDRLDELAIFVAIVDEGSLAAAGRKLRRSPPAVTRALATLEERVATRLVERTTRRCRPTEAGRRLAEHARQLLAGYGDAVGEAAAGSVRGVLRVTAPLVFGRRHVTPIVASFLDAYPGVRVELVLSDRNLDLIADELELATAVEEADLVVTGEGFVDEASFDGKVVGGLVALAAEFEVPVLVVAGEVFDGVGDRVDAVSLVTQFGRERAMADTAACIAEAVAARLDDLRI